MRKWAIACVLVFVATTAATAAEIKTGRDLVNACRDYMTSDTGQDNNAARAPHPCRSFLQGFFVSLVARENARTDSMLKGLPYTSREACVRMPDFLSYREMSGRIVGFAQKHPEAMAWPAATLAQKTLEADFPCPPPTGTPR